MRIAFRVDASLAIGSGHVMRCLTLADELSGKGAQSIFLCRELQGNLISFIEGRGYFVKSLIPEFEGSVSLQEDVRQCVYELKSHGGVDWVVVDSYYLDASWETPLRSVVGRIFVIDDLADRLHDCDVLLDQNYFADALIRYNGLATWGCRKLLGPSFAILRPEFKSARANLRLRDGRINHILVFFGGCDLGNETFKALMAIQNLKRPDLQVDVVIGLQNPHRSDLEALASSMKRVTTHFHVSNMAELIEKSDLYIGAAGTTTWERCCLGLPSLVITVAANQVLATIDLDRLGVLTYLGDSNTVMADQISTAIDACMLSKQRMKTQSEIGSKLVDGYGASRCADSMIYFSRGEDDGEKIQDNY